MTGHTDESLLRPVKDRQRIPSVDVLRGVALLGILLMNIVGMSMPDPAYWDPSGWGGETGWNLRVWFINSVFFEGTMRGIFSMLFGAGVILFTARKEQEGAGLVLANAWYRRTLWLIVFGLAHAYLLVWPGEILYAYGIAGMFLFPARNASPSRLIGFSVFLVLAIAVLNVRDARNALVLQEKAEIAGMLQEKGRELSPEQEAALAEWKEIEAELKPDLESRKRTVRLMRSGYFSAVQTMAPISRFMQTDFFFRHNFLDVLSMMLLGMGLFRLGILQAERKPLLYAGMVLIGYGIGIPVNWMETTSYMADHFSIVSYYQTGRTYDLGRIFTMLGHVGLVMLVVKSRWMVFLKRSLAAVGRMALTNYIMHTVIATTVFGIFRQYGQWERYQLYFLVAGIWGFQLIASPVWLRHFRFGPLEWLWRWLTYRRRPRLRRIPGSPGSGTSVPGSG